jgi:adenine nucleotide transporter 17
MSSESIATEVLAASLGGAISASILYPLEVLKTKMQAVDHSTSSSSSDENSENDDSSNEPKTEKEQLSMIPFMKQLYEEQGLGVFFRGMETSAFQSALENALYFFAYTTLKNMHSAATNGARLDTVTNLLLGCAAEWAHLPVSLPVDAWTTKIQTQSTLPGKQHQAPMHILMTMMQDKDCKFYKGLSAYYLLCFKPALQYTIFEQVKEVWLSSKNATGSSSSGISSSKHAQASLSAAEAFVLGMVARTIATVLVFPFLRAKVVMQTRKTTTSTSTATDDTASESTNDNDTNGSPNNSSKKDSVMTLLYEIWQTKGVAGLYQGLGPELTRGIFSAALMLMIKEKIATAVRTAVEGRRDVRKRQMASSR